MYQARRKETETSTNKFVNLCNFIQNQYLSENRRRIKTEIENVALETANKVRQSE